MKDDIRGERTQTAKHRFYLYRTDEREAWPFSVCDGESEPRAIGKFKSRNIAEMFLRCVREAYVENLPFLTKTAIAEKPPAG